jgi:formate hydrogenlyase subunit 6/NADH:ubiquinone oxidoreductase subunit I
MCGAVPAHRCKALVTYSITDACIGCTKCARSARRRHRAAPYQVHEVDMGKCVRCNACYDICPPGP